MRTFPTTLALAAALLAAAGPAPADEVEHRMLAERLLQIEGVDRQTAETFDRLRMANLLHARRLAATREQEARFPEIEERVGALVAEELSWPRVRARFVDLYVAAYSVEELEEILAFFTSPAGRAYLEGAPALRDRCARITRELAAAVAPRIRALVAEYREAPEEDGGDAPD